MKISKKYSGKKMFLQKFDILINKQASPITNFNDEVTKLPSGGDITRFDGKVTSYHIYFIRFSTLKIATEVIHSNDVILICSKPVLILQHF
jgi:hypothetical protein